jgi:hypothetical protein
MQAYEELSGIRLAIAKAGWFNLRYAACGVNWLFEKIGLHKQIANRIIEPWMWSTYLITATDWDNLFCLRDHHAAQPELRHVIKLLINAYYNSKPKRLDYDEWHLPFIQQEETYLNSIEYLKKVSVARCARISYLTHDGKRDTKKDIDLFNRLLDPSGNGDPDEPSHMSPFEHVATPQKEINSMTGNFRGWNQFRKYFPNENRTNYKYDLSRS